MRWPDGTLKNRFRRSQNVSPSFHAVSPARMLRRGCPTRRPAPRRQISLLKATFSPKFVLALIVSTIGYPCLEPYHHHQTQRQTWRLAIAPTQQVPEMQFFFLRFNNKNRTVSIICMSLFVLKSDFAPTPTLDGKKLYGLSEG